MAKHFGKVTTCPACEAKFKGDWLLQSELRMLALKAGPQAAESELVERYQEAHDND